MKPSLIAFLLLPTAVLADAAREPLLFTSSSETQNYGLYLVAAPTDCPATRFLVLGEGVQAVSVALKPGESALLPLGQGFTAGEHGLQVSPIGCDAAIDSLRLVTMNRASPGHGRAQSLTIFSAD